jgi:acyl-CoA dehydrogenase
MNVFLSEEERMLAASVRSYLDAKIAPLVAEHERAREFPFERLKDLYDFGYVRGVVPVADGGDGASHMVLAILMEEAGRCWGSLRTTLNIQTMVAYVLARHATAGSP